MSEHNPVTPQIQALLDQIPASKGGGKYLDQLDEGGREVLNLFEKWLVAVEEKSETTARAYKGYVAKAIVELKANPEYELDTDVKSAINALRRFQKAEITDVLESDDEGPIEPTGDDAS